MDPVRDEDEPEYTDRFRCGHCGHTTTIPSRLVVFTQILSVILGGAVSLHLLLKHLGAVLNGWQDGQGQPLLLDTSLAMFAATLLGGFAYTLYRAVHNMYKRQRYLHPGRQS